MPHDPSADAVPTRHVPAQPVPAQPVQPVPAVADRDEPDVIEWGDNTSPRRRSPFRLPGRLREGRRLIPLTVAALGFAALFGSLVGEWGTISLREEGAVGPPARQELIAAASNIGGLGAAYLVGILAVAVLAALAFFGTASVRSNSRVAGTAATAGLLALLVAATVSLEDVVRRAFFAPSDIRLEVDYGQGLVLGYAGTLAVGLALYLAGRPSAGPAATWDERTHGEPDESDQRHRPRRVSAEHDEPVREVTVLPAPPFTGPDWRQQYPQ